MFTLGFIYSLGYDLLEDHGFLWHKDDLKGAAGGSGRGPDGVHREEATWPRMVLRKCAWAGMTPGLISAPTHTPRPRLLANFASTSLSFIICKMGVAKALPQRFKDN